MQVLNVGQACRATVNSCHQFGHFVARLGRKIATAVREFFQSIAAFFGKLCAKRHQNDLFNPNVGQDPFQNLFNPLPAAFHGVIPLSDQLVKTSVVQIPPPLLAPDVHQGFNHDQSLAAVRKSMQQNRGLRVESDFLNLTPRDFIALHAEFPHQQKALIGASIKWAKQKVLQIDPHHPLFEIFDYLLKNKNHLGGRVCSDDYQTYIMESNENSKGEYYWGYEKDKFHYIIFTLIGIQEMFRKDVRDWMRLIDNGKETFDTNVGYQFARALSRIFIYPFPPEFNGKKNDFPEKLHSAANIFWTAWVNVKTLGDQDLFFSKAFDTNNNCFAGRARLVEEFIAKKCISDGDFGVNFTSGDKISKRASEHLRVCMNIQMKKFADQGQITYKDLQHWVTAYGSEGIPANLLHLAKDPRNQPINEQTRGRVNGQLRIFYEQFFKPENFAAHLADNNQPLHMLIPVFDEHEGKEILKALGPVIQRGDTQDPAHGLIQGWETIFRNDGIWPDAWK